MAVTLCSKVEDTFSVGKPGEISTLKEKYVLTVDADDTLLAISLDAFAGKPLMRTRHPVAALKNFIVSHIEIQPTGFRSYNYVVDYTHKLQTTQQDSGSSKFVSMSRRASRRRLNLWKLPGGAFPAGLPTNGTTPWPPNAVATGSSVDIMGAPQPYEIWHHDIFLQFEVDTPKLQQSTGTAYSTAIILTGFSGARNSEVFLGYSVGQVAMIGWDEQLTQDPLTTVNVHFKADKFYHLEQRILPKVDGSPYLTGAAVWASKPVKQVDSAFWYQPFTLNGLSDFNLMGNFSELETPTPIYVP